MPVAAPALEVRGLTVERGGRTVLDDVSLAVPEGDLLGVLGSNGSGKTTLFRAILGMQACWKGQVLLFGRGPGEFGPIVPLIGYVPQSVPLDPNFPASVRDVVAMGAIPKRLARAGEALVGGGDARRRARGPGEAADAALGAAGLSHLAERRIGELSGGEQRRVFIARALVKDPPLIILDEPVAGVDAESQEQFYDVMGGINDERGITVLWSSHDMEAMEGRAKSVACLDRKLLFHGPCGKFFADGRAVGAYAESAAHAAECHR